MEKGKKLFLIDTMALIYRAHFALHQYTRRNSEGMEVGALLGLTNTLLDLLQKQSPTHVVAVYDSKETTWRKELYPAYKAQREQQPEGITIAIPYTKKLFDAFQIPHISLPGYEADDIIGTLTKQALALDFDTYIVSADKDLAQLVEEHISIYKPSSRGKPPTIQRLQDILAEWQIAKPSQVIDILGLWGDSSDNIPGVPGIGSKTARKLIASFGSIEGVLDNLAELKPALRKKMEIHREQALLSKKLATIITDIPLDLNLATCGYKGFEPTLLAALLKKLEFRTLSKRLFGPAKKQLTLFDTPLIQPNLPSFRTYKEVPHHYQSVDTPAALASMVAELKDCPYFSFDTETTGLNLEKASLLGISISHRPHQGYFIPVPKEKETWQKTLQVLRELFGDPNQLKIAQNAKFDLRILAKHNLFVTGPLFDTMLAHALLEPDQPHSLNALAEAYLEYTPIPIEDLIGPKGKNQHTLGCVPLEDLVVYACEDSDITLQLYEKLAPQLIEQGADGLLKELIMPLLPVLAKMEARGIAIDRTILAEISEDLSKGLLVAEEKIHTLAGKVFNVASPKQLGQVLFGEMKIEEKPTKTPKGQYATNEIILKRLIKKHPIIKEILAYREYKKLKSTYVDALPVLLDTNDRIHTSYLQGVVSTGRLSSVQPNLQNIPIRTERGRLIRKAFVAQGKDSFLLSADYSQIELRIMAHFAQDEEMIATFRANRDIHRLTAAKVFHVTEEEVTDAMRRKAKMVNFGLIYGISAYGLSQRLDIPRREAAEIINAYFKKFPNIKKYINDTIAEARERGYVTTLLGRKRFLPDLNSKNATMRGFSERNAINMPIQGTMAELIQRAMINIEKWLTESRLPARMILQVHDELIFEVDQSALEELKVKIPQLMIKALPLSVPIAVTVGVGKNWLEAH